MYEALLSSLKDCFQTKQISVREWIEFMWTTWTWV